MLLQPTLLAGVEIAGAACRLRCPDEAFASFLADRYAGFVPTTAPVLEVDVTVIPAEQAVLAAWSGPYARVAGHDDVITVDGPGFHGRFDEASGRGAIRQPPDAEPLETLLTAIHASRLLARGGCILHAATIVGRAGACVFFGPSGSGKTTVTELVGEGVLTDEISLLRPSPAGGYLVSSVPWRGQPRTAPLAGLYRLRQAHAVALRRLSPAEAVRHLLPSVFFCRGDAREMARFLETAATLARVAPAWELDFTRDRGFWDVVNGGVRR